MALSFVLTTQELVLPLTVTAKSLDKLRRWEEPHLTAAFLAFAYAIIFRYNIFTVATS